MAERCCHGGTDQRYCCFGAVPELSITYNTYMDQGEEAQVSVLEAGQLADDYTEARKQVKEEKNSSGDTIQKGKPSTPMPEE